MSGSNVTVPGVARADKLIAEKAAIAMAKERQRQEKAALAERKAKQARQGGEQRGHNGGQSG